MLFFMLVISDKSYYNCKKQMFNDRDENANYNYHTKISVFVFENFSK